MRSEADHRSVIAGEEPELCLRLRRNGWTILRIDAEMAIHDMGMTRFGQWWKVGEGRTFLRGGLPDHRLGPDRHLYRETRNAVVWGFLLPIVALGLAWLTRGLSLALFAGYFLLYHKTKRYYVVQRLAEGSRQPERRLDRAGQAPQPSAQPAMWLVN